MGVPDGIVESETKGQASILVTLLAFEKVFL
jgi:hypothetical protein